jgi:ribosomal protein S18 acetylase RimI-like enzyme
LEAGPEQESAVNIVFSSKAPKNSREKLEELLFFNPRQFRVRSGILDSLKQFGHPRLEDTEDGLAVRVGDHEAQTLFAFDRDRRNGELVGVVVFLRTAPAEIAIMHVAVHPDYALQGRHGGTGLGVELVEQVKAIASRIVGVKRIVFVYRNEVVIRL